MGNIFNFGFGVKDPAFVCRLLDMLSESQRGRIFKALYDFDGQGAFPETTNRMLNLVLCVIAHQAGLAPAESLPAPAPSGTFSAEAPASSDSAEALAAAEELTAATAEEAEAEDAPEAAGAELPPSLLPQATRVRDIAIARASARNFFIPFTPYFP